MRNKNAAVSDPNEFKTCPGSKVHITFAPKILENGVIKLIPSGKEDIQDKINSFRDSCDMSLILKRLALGDTSVINQNKPMYGDFTAAPKTYAQALQLVMDGEKEFMKLPLDVRNEFNNDFKQWFASAGSTDWINKMDAYIVKPEEKEKDVTEPGE